MSNFIALVLCLGLLVVLLVNFDKIPKFTINFKWEGNDKTKNIVKQPEPKKNKKRETKIESEIETLNSADTDNSHSDFSLSQLDV